MLNTIATYLDAFARAIIVSRGLDMDRLVLDEVYRLSIVNYLGEAHVPAKDTHPTLPAQGLPKAA